MKFRCSILSVVLFFSGGINAANLYNPNKSYVGGEQVSFNGAIYEAQWWANAQQSPAEITNNSWESPWVLISKTGGTTTPMNETEDDLDAAPPKVGDYPQYSEEKVYAGGDIIINAGELYRCKAGVTQAWCSEAAWAYAPGVGTAWEQAWEKISESALESVEEPTLESGYVVSQTTLSDKERILTNFPAMVSVKEAIRTIDNETVNAIKPLSPDNPENVRRVESIVSDADWEFMFPKRAQEYTYRHFLQAVGKFPSFCGTYIDGRDSDEICRKSLATMFAHFTQETGGHTAHWEVPEWRQGLVHIREMGWTEKMRGGYNGECNPDVWQGQTWPCGTFDNGEYKSYFGRGAKQLSYNYNYGPFSEAMFGTVRVLLDNPEIVADSWLNLASAIFFFTYPQPPKPSMLHVIDGTWVPNSRDLKNGLTGGFGVTTQIINGGVECGGSVEVAQSLNRIDYYKEFANYLGVSILDNEVLGCKEMKQFDAEGSGAVNIYWEKDWGWSPETPSGATYSCQLVGYQTPYSAFKEGDFAKCVEANFPDAIIKL
ncbi:chitinase [Vibrio fluvialis]|nr:chitinase [Vibrio fluvialis]